jgi:hypothetical protein
MTMRSLLLAATMAVLAPLAACGTPAYVADPNDPNTQLCRDVASCRTDMEADDTPSPPPKPPFDAQASSNLLKPGEAQADVHSALGWMPGHTNLETCGQETAGGSWQCLNEYYQGPNGTLDVVYRQEDDGWVVNAWNTN